MITVSSKRKVSIPFGEQGTKKQNAVTATAQTLFPKAAGGAAGGAAVDSTGPTLADLSKKNDAIRGAAFFFLEPPPAAHRVYDFDKLVNLVTRRLNVAITDVLSMEMDQFLRNADDNEDDLDHNIYNCFYYTMAIDVTAQNGCLSFFINEEPPIEDFPGFTSEQLCPVFHQCAKMLRRNAAGILGRGWSSVCLEHNALPTLAFPDRRMTLIFVCPNSPKGYTFRWLCCGRLQFKVTLVIFASENDLGLYLSRSTDAFHPDMSHPDLYRSMQKVELDGQNRFRDMIGKMTELGTPFSTMGRPTVCDTPPEFSFNASTGEIDAGGRMLRVHSMHNSRFDMECPDHVAHPTLTDIMQSQQFRADISNDLIQGSIVGGTRPDYMLDLHVPAKIVIIAVHTFESEPLL